MRRLYRSRDERMVAGVAGGLAEYFGVDPTLLRLAFVALTLGGGGVGLAGYVLLAILAPMEPVAGTLKAEAQAEAMRHAAAPEQTRREVQESRVPEFER